MPELNVAPGGVANQAISCVRLGLQAQLITAVGTDRLGQLTADMLREENVGMCLASEVERQNLTVSQVLADDRAMTTFGTLDVPYPDENTERPCLFFASIHYLCEVADVVESWRSEGTYVVADTGWDDTEEWDQKFLEGLRHADVFVPNCGEAMAYTRTSTPADAARALTEHVETVIVTCGGRGVVLAQAGSDDVTEVPAIPTTLVDPTGAGDAFSAGFASASVSGLDLVDSIHVGMSAGAWTVGRVGGSTAPTIAELAGWIEGHPEAGDDVRSAVARFTATSPRD